MAIIEARDVVKVYETGKVRLKALQSVSISVERGEMVGVMGPSGCGKTTLLNCLSGLDEIDSGTIVIEGKDISKMSDNQKTTQRADRMGFIFQAYNLLPVLSAVENVELPLLVSGKKMAEARKRALKALELVDLVKWADHKPAELSGGQQQRVTIARSIVNEPAIVWADEPTGNLDTKNSMQIMDLLCQLNNDLKQTYIVVTHDPKVGARCDRILNMESGLVVKDVKNGHGNPCKNGGAKAAKEADKEENDQRTV